jgi:hypothetical protein
MRKLSTIVSMSALAAFALASPAQAHDTKVGVRGGYYTKIKEPFVGVELLTRVANRVYFNPNLEYVFVDGAKYFTLNGDFHYDFPTGGNDVYVWLGAGLGWSSFDPEGPDNSDNDLVANLLGGVGFNAGSVIPYVQGKVIIREDTEFSIAVGLRF